MAKRRESASEHTVNALGTNEENRRESNGTHHSRAVSGKYTRKEALISQLLKLCA